MADTNFFDGFTITWSQDGAQAPISQEAYRAGWAFVGETPPAMEQFNAVHWMDSRRQQWLFGQIKGVTDQASMPLSAGATDTLWLAIKSKLDAKQASLGFNPVQQGGGIGQGTNKVYIGWAGGTLRATVDSTDLGSFVFAGRQFTAGAGLTGGGTFDSDRVLSMGTPSAITASSGNAAGGTTHTHAFNVTLQEMGGNLPVAKGGTGATDPGGARSNLGLADVLHVVASLMQANGYFHLASDDGRAIIVQWGAATIPGDGFANITWPIPFPTECLQAFSCMGANFATTIDAGSAIHSPTRTGATIVNGFNNAILHRYIAIGF